MSTPTCVRCGKETAEGQLYCPECQPVSLSRKSRRLWTFSLAFSALILALTALLLWHGGMRLPDFSLDSLLGRPAAVVNGENISRDDLNTRVKMIRGMLERQYGKNIFEGERGRNLLGNMESQVLDGMVEEKLIGQEAGKWGIRISDKEVNDKLDQITQQVFGAWDKFEERLREDGMSKKDLEGNLRYLLLLDELKKAKTPKGADPEISFNAWLMQARGNALVTLYALPPRNLSGSSLPSCCAPGGNGAAAASRGGPLDPAVENQAKEAALKAFRETNPPGEGVTAKVTNYGCHVQVDVQKEGKIIKSYSYQGGKVYDIS